VPGGDQKGEREGGEDARLAERQDHIAERLTPRFVGGTGTAMIGDFIEQQFSLRFDWPMGSAMSFSTLAASVLVIVLVGLALRAGVRR
ncbi:MAG TPA: hypothetical protein VFZ07_06805, partial [Dongiaceae bacterium]